MLTKEQLEQVLRRLPAIESAQITIVRDGGKFLATVVTPFFSNLDEGERQSLVLNHIFRELTEDDSDLIEFVFTDAPGEDAAEE